MPDNFPIIRTKSASPASPWETGWPDRSLSAKFFLVLASVFVVAAVIGTLLLSYYDRHKGAEALAARIGNQSARVATALGSHHAMTADASHARDMMNILFSDPAIRCLEFRLPPSAASGNGAGIPAAGRLLYSLPAPDGCEKAQDMAHLSLPVETMSGAPATLKVVYSNTEIEAAVQARRNLDLAFVAAAFLIALFSALVAFRVSVMRPLSRLYASILHAKATGERLPVDRASRDELGTIIAAYNDMLEREETVEEGLSHASDQFAALNRTLEERVRLRTDELAESEHRLTAVIQGFTSGIYIHRDFKPLYANDTFLDMLGYENLDQFLATGSIDEMLAPEERERLWNYAQERMRGGDVPSDYEFWALGRDGEKLLVNNRTFVLDWNGEPAICGALFDLSSGREIESSLAEQRHLMNSLMETTHEGFWFIDTELRTTDVNPAMCAMLRRSRDEVVGRSIFDFVDDANAAIFREQIARRRSNATGSYEVALLRPDGSHLPCVNTATPLFSSDGKRYGSVGIWTDISDIKAVQRSLEREKERALAASIAKSEFLAIASHELRTPMNGVLGIADLLADSGLSDEQKRHIDLIRESGRSLLGLLNEILDISKIEAGQLELERHPFDPRDLIGGVTALMRSRAHQKNLVFKERIGDDVPENLGGDATRIRQVLTNVVGNAVKFTSSGHIGIQVEISSWGPQAATLRIEVTDTGPGIAPELHDAIFEKFTQADSSTTRKFGGTGLGLAICRELTTLMGGAIGVDSEPGSGSTFWIEIPCNVIQNSAGARFASVVVPATDPDIEPNTMKSLDVLVAEDNDINRIITVETLERAGHRVAVAGNGREAIDRLQSARFDIVLMDIHMPVMDGIEATRAIRGMDDDTSGVPIVALTAAAMQGDRQKFIDAGMDGYVSKPFDSAGLFMVMSEALTGAGRSSVPAQTTTLPAPAPGTFGPPLSTDPIDADVANPLRLGKPALWATLVDVFQTSSASGLNELRSGLDAQDSAAVHMAAHTLKSSSANMGASRLSALCRGLEEMAREAALSEAAPLLAEIEAETDRVVRALAAQRPATPPSPDRRAG